MRFRLPDSEDFSALNLPYGVFSPAALREQTSSQTSCEDARRIGVALGDYVLDCRALARAGILPEVMAQPTLNALMELGKPSWASVRSVLREIATSSESPLSISALHGATAVTAVEADLNGVEADLSQAAARLREAVYDNSQTAREKFAFPRDEVSMHMPCEVGDFTDFFTSPQHAGRGHESRLRESNWSAMPVGYHGRCSTLQVADFNIGRSSIRRPHGQYCVGGDGQSVRFGPSRWLDYELEVGVFVGGAVSNSELEVPSGGAPSGGALLRNSLAAAEDRLFGLVLLNDWSARDLQRFEMAPLGPFLGKSFATTISPWIVPVAALQSCRVGGPPSGPRQDSKDSGSGSSLGPVSPHLAYDHCSEGSSAGEGCRGTGARRNFDVRLSADLEVGASDAVPGPAHAAHAAHAVCRTNLDCMYWSFAQMLAHQQSNGCEALAGDLLGSGTLSSWTGPPLVGEAEEPSACRRQAEDETARRRQAQAWGCLAEQNLYGRRACRFDSPDGSTCVDRVWLEDGDCVVLSGAAFVSAPSAPDGQRTRVGFGQSRTVVLPAAEYEH
eukprot:gene6-351_t